MNFSMIWPIALIVLANILYNVCSKETPQDIDPLASLTVTYLVGAGFSALLYVLLNKKANLFAEYSHLNWTSFVLGLAVVGLEAGSIYMYKAGWKISSGQLVYSIVLAVCLVIIGVAFYHESISPTKAAGIAVCALGLYLINR